MTTILIAHPDDEVLFMWPRLFQADKIICCSSDLHNPQREWCKSRKRILARVAEAVGAELVCLDYDSEFYRLPTRNEELLAMAEEVRGHLPGWGDLMTHNPIGEYGNLDHILVHTLARLTRLRLLYTDNQIQSNWLPVTGKVWRGARSIQLCKWAEHAERLDEFVRWYKEAGMWTWSLPIPKTVELLESL